LLLKENCFKRVGEITLKRFVKRGQLKLRTCSDPSKFFQVYDPLIGRTVKWLSLEKEIPLTRSESERNPQLDDRGRR
jgi:hypothetical protein